MEVAVEAIHQHFTAWTPRVKPSKDGEARADVGSHKTGWKSTYANNQKNCEGSSESFFFVALSKFDMTLLPKVAQESPA